MKPKVAIIHSMEITREAIATVYDRIRPHLRRTPMVQVDGADFGLQSGPISFKLELLQHAGSFKARGALANLLLRPIPKAGVVAASGGNHGLAVAFAARKLQTSATIFVPSVAAATKCERIREFGANLVVAGDRYADALAASREFAAESGALEIHAFDQPETLLGQGSLALEVEADAPLDTLLVAVGGGDGRPPERQLPSSAARARGCCPVRRQHGRGELLTTATSTLANE